MYSQSGEQLIIEELFSYLERTDSPRVLVEFGASRGKDNSNLFAFGESGHNLVLIEADSDRYKDLEVAIAPHPNILGIQAKVLFSSSTVKKRGGQEGTLSEILLAHGVNPKNLAVVSIDIDGDDAAVFESLEFVPEIVICEFNPLFPSDAIYRNPAGKNIGNSPLSVLRVATKLGMFLAATTQTNLIFMRSEYSDRVPKIDLPQSIQSLDLVRFAWGYDGTFVRFSTEGKDLTRGIYHNGWNDSFLRQPLPAGLRAFSKTRRWVRILYFCFGSLAQPIETMKLVVSAIQAAISNNSKN